MSPVPYGMVPGQRHELPGITIPDATPAPDQINLDESPPTPYGMEPGKRHFLPGITPLLQQSSPIGGAPPQDPQEDESQYRDENGHELGISFMLDGKRVNLKPNLEASHEHRGRQINDLGQALMKHAHTDAEKQAAERAAAWGLAQADTDIPLEHVMKSMDESYRKDTGYEQALARQLLVNQGHLEAAKAGHRFGGGGVGGPSLKQQKFEAEVVEKHADDINNIIGQESQRFDFKKTQENIQAYQSVATLMASNNPGSQNLAEARALLALTGKQATARELQNIRMMDGALEMWENEVNRYFPDPQKTEGYRRQFIAAMNDAVQTAKSYQTGAAERSVARIKTQLWFRDLPPEDQQLVISNVRGSMGGEFDLPDESAAPAQSAQRPSPKPAMSPGNAAPHSRVNSLLGGH